jgi:hypothetical protein
MGNGPDNLVRESRGIDRANAHNETRGERVIHSTTAPVSALGVTASLAQPSVTSCYNRAREGA